MEEYVKVKNVFVSTHNKDGLNDLIKSLIHECPGVNFISKGDSYNFVTNILNTYDEEADGNPAYSAQSHTMSEGLLKASYKDINLFIVNLPNAEKIIEDPELDIETKMSTLDSQELHMIRKSANNVANCAIVTDAIDYGHLKSDIGTNNGSISYEERILLAAKALEISAKHDLAVSEYLMTKPIPELIK